MSELVILWASVDQSIAQHDVKERICDLQFVFCSDKAFVKYDLSKEDQVVSVKNLLIKLAFTPNISHATHSILGNGLNEEVLGSLHQIFDEEFAEVGIALHESQKSQRLSLAHVVHEWSLIDLFDVLSNHIVVVDQVADLLEGRFSSDHTERLGVKLVTCLSQDGHEHVTTCAALQHLQNVDILVCDIVRFELGSSLSILDSRHFSQFRLIFCTMRVRKPEFFLDLLIQSFV